MNVPVERLAALFGVLVALFASTAANSAPPVTEQLSAATRQLLIEEMQSLATAMGPLHTAVVVGDHGTVAEQARRIHDSFILKRKLSREQRTEITALTPSFLESDRRFHALAAGLAQAGSQRNSALQRFYFGEMSRACVSCHRDFALERFPGLRETADAGTHSH